ncbi:MAG: SCO family protein [Stappiaceae bacterium]
MSATKIIRYGAWAAIAVLAFAVAAVTMGGLGKWQPGGADSGTTQLASIGGPFSMINHEGKPFTEKGLLGKPSAIFFGYTHCPDVCPTTLAELQGWIEDLGPDADKLNYVFVSVDPERDTPEIMNSYVHAFDDRIIALTGSTDQVSKMVKAYRVYARKVENGDDNYTMDHSAGVYLMDENNQFVGMIAYAEAPENAVEKLKNLTKRVPVS